MKPKVKLTGKDGNAFAIIGECVKAGKKAGWTPEKVSEFRSKALSGTYQDLLRLACEELDVS